MKIFEAIGLFGGGVLAGLFLCSCLVEQAMRRLDAESWLAYKQAKERLFGPVMPMIFGAVLAGQFALAVSAPYHRVIFGLSSAMLGAALVITVTVHLPLNRVFQSWSAASIPASWQHDRQRWQRWNWARCLPTMAAFAAGLLGMT